MSFHPCPIEPWDWGNGPDEPEPKDCPDCEDGWITNEVGVKEQCKRCEGEGFYYPDPSDYEPLEDDVL